MDGLKPSSQTVRGVLCIEENRKECKGKPSKHCRVGRKAVHCLPFSMQAINGGAVA